MTKTYTAMFVTDEGETVHQSVTLDEDIILQYCIAADARSWNTLDTIFAVATQDESLQDAIMGLEKRFDPHEPMTPQLLAYREGYAHA
jgi:hypothetical protein